MIVDTKSADASILVETKKTDAYGRVPLPDGFDNAIVTVERVSDTEVRIHKVANVPDEEYVFLEEMPEFCLLGMLELLLNLLENPPEPNEALKRAAARHG